MDCFGTKFKVTIFGESHGSQVGAVIEGVPAEMPLCAADFACDLARRAAGAFGTTARREPDAPLFESGLRTSSSTSEDSSCQQADPADYTATGHAAYSNSCVTVLSTDCPQAGFTTGEPLTIAFDNTNIRPCDYAKFADTPRPGHADYVAQRRFGSLPTGGGHFSGRLTLPVVAAGVVAKKVLESLSIQDSAFYVANRQMTTSSNEADKVQKPSFNAELIQVGGSDDESAWQELLRQAAADGDSLGGVVECRVSGLPVGLGEPFWDSVESVISHAIFAIPGVRGIEFGDGFAASAMRGSQHNDPFGPDGPLKNGSGGVNGGLTNGAPLVFRVAFKPTSSISRPQRTWNFAVGAEDTLCVTGRHDVCFALRTPPIVEAAAAIALADLALTRFE